MLLSLSIFQEHVHASATTHEPLPPLEDIAYSFLQILFDCSTRRIWREHRLGQFIGFILHKCLLRGASFLKKPGKKCTERKGYYYFQAYLQFPAGADPPVPIPVPLLASQHASTIGTAAVINDTTPVEEQRGAKSRTRHS